MPFLRIKQNKFLKCKVIVMIYFDNAATGGKKPQTVINAVNYALKNYCANPGRSGHRLSEKTALAVFFARQKAANFFGADGLEQVIFTASCTHAINCVLKGVLNSGDHIIVSSLEHNAVMRPLVKCGAEYSVAEVSLTDDGETLDNFRRLIKRNTKMIFCTAASNVLGKLLPIEEIGKLASENGILFGLDAAQAAGAYPINMQKMNIDFLCIAPHKSLYAPMGIGVLIARKPIEKTFIEGGTGSNSADFLQGTELPEDFESGTLNVPAICGFAAGLDYLKKQTVKRVYNYEMSLIERLFLGLSKIDGVILYTKPERDKYMPVLSFNLVGYNSAETAEILNNCGIAVRAGLHCAPSAHRQINTLDSGAVRVSVSAYNTAYEVDCFLREVKNIKKL